MDVHIYLEFCDNVVFSNDFLSHWETVKSVDSKCSSLNCSSTGNLKCVSAKEPILQLSLGQVFELKIKTISSDILAFTSANLCLPLPLLLQQS